MTLPETERAPGDAYAVLSARSLTKSYAEIPVLLDVSLDFRGGEVHAIVGENGAGKSTLIKILSGVVQPSGGELAVRGEPVRLANPYDALSRGISAVHQEFNYCPSRTVTENLFLGRRFPRSRLGLLDWRAADEHAEAALSELGVQVDVRREVGSLSPEVRKLVEIARALVHRSDVLILDEPTAALPAAESERLFDIIGTLRARGVAVAYVSHRMAEVMKLADRVSVLRDGRLVQTQERAEANVDSLIRVMVGRALSLEYPPRDAAKKSETLLEVRGLSSPGAFSDVSLHIGRGEIVGIAGLDGSGRSELARALSGDLPCDRGEIILAGKRVGPGRSVYEMISSGIVYVPPDRQHDGLHLDMTIADNISLPLLRADVRGPFVDRRAQQRRAEEYAKRLQIRPPGVEHPCSSLSGGNQQKVLLAKWMATKPRVLLLDEPTRGVDVGAKSEIHTLIRKLAADGATVLLASSEMLELLGMSDRVVVLRAGAVAGEFSASSVTAEEIGFAAAGAAPELIP